MRGLKSRTCEAYFTVEAAMVLPVVMCCYWIMCMLMIFMYERCILEENACRVLVWKSYIEGSLASRSATQEVEVQEIEEILQTGLQKEEEQRYLLGGNVRTGMKNKGKKFCLTRIMQYSGMWDVNCEIEIENQYVDPVKHIRTVNFLQDKLEEVGSDE